MTATKTTKTKPKTKRAATKDVDPGELKDPLADSMFEKEQNRGIYDVSHKAFSFVVCPG